MHILKYTYIQNSLTSIGCMSHILDTGWIGYLQSNLHIPQCKIQRKGNVTIMGTVMSATADVGLNLGGKGLTAYIQILLCVQPDFQVLGIPVIVNL